MGNQMTYIPCRKVMDEGFEGRSGGGDGLRLQVVSQGAVGQEKRVERVEKLPHVVMGLQAIEGCGRIGDVDSVFAAANPLV